MLSWLHDPVEIRYPKVLALLAITHFSLRIKNAHLLTRIATLLRCFNDLPLRAQVQSLQIYNLRLV
jgi:hypothetical protein